MKTSNQWTITVWAIIYVEEVIVWFYAKTKTEGGGNVTKRIAKAVVHQITLDLDKQYYMEVYLTKENMYWICLANKY